MKPPRFDHSSQLAALVFIRQNIDRHKQFALGTVDPQGNPWVVCLNLSYDDKFNIIWKSQKDSLHSKYIEAHPTVSLCIFSETDEIGDFGMYATAEAIEVSDILELARLIDIRFTKKDNPAPGPEEFLGDTGTRLYYANLTSLWLNDDTHEKVKINLEEL